MLKIMDTINDVAGNLRDWIVENGDNPLLWFGIIAFFLVFFGIAFRGLKKD